MNRPIIFAGLLAFTMQAWGAAQWQNISVSTNPVTYTIVTNVLGFTGSTTTYLRSDGTQATPAGTGAYAVTNYFITPSTGITVATNVTGTNVTWTVSSTVVSGGNMTNSGASVIGMVPVATDTTGTQWTPTNSISLDDVIAGTLSLSNMTANVIPGFDSNTNMVPTSMTTNVLDLLYSQSGNLTNWGKLTTNEFLPLAGGTVTGPVLSISPTTNGPTTLELATAGWVRSLLANGSLLYNSTNVVGTAFDASTYKYVGSEPTNGSRSYTPSAGDYIGTVMTTNRYEEVVGPIHITTYFTSSGGAASAQYTLHPEIYYTYDTNSPTLLGDYASAPQAITHGAITNQYDFVVSFPPIINTNTPGNGFYIVRRFKIDTKTGTDTLKLSLGTNGVNNTSSHIAFSTPAISGANWVASGTTNSTLAGDAQPYSVTMGGTNVIGAIAGKIGKSESYAITNKTFTSSAHTATTGNTLKQSKYMLLTRPDYGDGTKAVPQTNNFTASGLMHYTFAGDGETNTCWVVYETAVPPDIDTSVEMTATIAFVSGGTDTDTVTFHLTYALGAAGAALPTGTAIATSPIVVTTTPVTPASGDVQQSPVITLTGWAASMTAGTPLFIRMARLNDSNDDTQRDLYLRIAYGSTQ